MKKLVIMPGGFHPFHAGHMSLYNDAKKAFPDAEVYVAATNDTSQRPFPFKIKEKLAYLAGVEPGHFVQVKNPFKSEEITQNFDPDNTILIFVRSDKDRDQPPIPGGVKKDGTPAKLQPLNRNPGPMSQTVYMTYLPTVEFGPGITSASQIRATWPKLNDKRKTAMVMSLYPKTQKNPKLAATVVKMLDTAIQSISEEKTDQKFDTELQRARTFAKSHYPNYADNPDVAFDKWVQRSLMHSEVDDAKQNQTINDLQSKIKNIENQLNFIKKFASRDYVEEKR